MRDLLSEMYGEGAGEMASGLIAFAAPEENTVVRIHKCSQNIRMQKIINKIG